MATGMPRGRLGPDRGVGYNPDGCASAGHAKNHQRNEQPEQARERSPILQIAATLGHCPRRGVDHQDDGCDQNPGTQELRQSPRQRDPLAAPDWQGFPDR